jgi:uncharacterized membrane protein
MEEILGIIAERIALFVNLVAILAIAVGSIEAAFGLGRAIFTRLSRQAKAAIWLRFASWLVAALTFQLAADIVDTAIAPNWNDIGHLGAVAVIRTFLNYFLTRDMREIREEAESTAGSQQGAYLDGHQP